MATKQEIIEKIAVLLDEINQQHQALETPAPADSLKIDLFEATVNYFAAYVSVYSKLSKQEEGGAPAIATGAATVDAAFPEDEEIVFTPPAAPAPVEDPVPEEGEDPAEAIADEEETLLAEDDAAIEEITAVAPVIEEETTVAGQEEAVAPETDEEPALPVAGDPEETAVVETAADTTEEIVNEVVIQEKEVTVPASDLPVAAEEPEKPSRPLTINELMSAQRQAGGGRLFAAPRDGSEKIKDLKSAISLNDKLLFIKDLFNGYSLAYSEAIELLNRYDDFASADTFLQDNYAGKNNWAEKQATVDKLYAILRRRFG